MQFKDNALEPHVCIYIPATDVTVLFPTALLLPAQR